MADIVFTPQHKREMLHWKMGGPKPSFADDYQAQAAREQAAATPSSRHVSRIKHRMSGDTPPEPSNTAGWSPSDFANWEAYKRQEAAKLAAYYQAEAEDAERHRRERGAPFLRGIIRHIEKPFREAGKVIDQAAPLLDIVLPIVGAAVGSVVAGPFGAGIGGAATGAATADDAKAGLISGALQGLTYAANAPGYASAAGKAAASGAPGAGQGFALSQAPQFTLSGGAPAPSFGFTSGAARAGAPSFGFTKAALPTFSGAAASSGAPNFLAKTPSHYHMSLGATKSAPSYGLLDKMTGIHKPSLLNQLGMKSAPAGGGGIGFYGNAGHVGLLDKTGKYGALGKYVPMLGKALSALGGGAGSQGNQRGSQGTYDLSDYAPMDLRMQRSLIEEEPDGKRKKKGYRAKTITTELKPSPDNPDFLEEEEEEENIYTDDSNKLPVSSKEIRERLLPKRNYAEGGAVHRFEGGYLSESLSDGQADDLSKEIPDGSYVFNALDLALLGNGSNDNGAKKVKEWERDILAHGFKKQDLSSHRARPHRLQGEQQYVPVKLSNKEYVVRPEVVQLVGKGDPDKGAKIIDKGRKQLRKDKGVRDILPPKAKSLNIYMRRGK